MKQIEKAITTLITMCSQGCPHMKRDYSWRSYAVFYCDHFDKDKHVDEHSLIPEWCPLHDAPANDGLVEKLREFIVKLRGDSVSYIQWLQTKNNVNEVSLIFEKGVSSAVKDILNFLDDFESSPASDVPAQVRVKRIEWFATHKATTFYGKIHPKSEKVLFTIHETSAASCKGEYQLEDYTSKETVFSHHKTLPEAQLTAQTAVENFVKGMME